MNTREALYRRCAGFTLIELLVVITIIAVLIGLVAGAGVAVLGNKQVRLTEDILTTLDRALTDYMVSNDDTPPNYISTQYDNTPGTGYHPSQGGMNTSAGDGWETLNGVAYPRHPDAAVFIRAASGFGAVDSIIEGLGDSWLIPTPEPASGLVNATDSAPSVLDAWADPKDWRTPWPILGVTMIYYVHPDNLLAQQLYGRCVGGRPYFFSAGPDRLYGTSTQLSEDGQRGMAAEAMAAEAALDDNLYSYTPGSADLTAGFRGNVR